MGYVKEPAGVNFVVDPTPLTKDERKRISEIIAYYKATGRKMPVKKSKLRIRPKAAKKKDTGSINAG